MSKKAQLEIEADDVTGLTKIPLVNETFKDMRNFIALKDENFLRYNDSYESQCRSILQDELSRNDDELKEEYQKCFGITCEHCHGGSEGDGEEYWYIIKIFDKEADKDRLFKIPACYNSYDDSEFYFEETHEVEAYQELTTYYRRIE